MRGSVALLSSPVPGAGTVCCARLRGVSIAACVKSACLFRTLAKIFVVRCGFNPEGNVESQKPSRS
eukprot:4463673-Alexandrium_andersonii.AAC.1